MAHKLRLKAQMLPANNGSPELTGNLIANCISQDANERASLAFLLLSTILSLLFPHLAAFSRVSKTILIEIATLDSKRQVVTGRNPSSSPPSLPPSFQLEFLPSSAPARLEPYLCAGKNSTSASCSTSSPFSNEKLKFWLLSSTSWQPQPSHSIKQ